MVLRKTAALALVLIAASSAHGQTIARMEPPADAKPLPMREVGRAELDAGGLLLRQWPGTYEEASFTGPVAFFRVGPGEVSLRVSVDGGAPVALVKPAPGSYRVSGLGAGLHRLRVDVASESQAGATALGGFVAPAGTSAAPLPRRTRAIEFIGDSHTVGYGNTSTTRQCTPDQVWATTDTAQGLAPRTAAHYDADYEVNAISGRGVVRNYNGFAADTLPQAYPYTLFTKQQFARDPSWHPQVIVIALGTNDFSTPLNVGEKWATRDALRTDYENTYVRFVQQLRARDPDAQVILWATDFGGGEIQSEVGKVVDRLKAQGDARVGFVPVGGLAFSACNYHPSVADDQKIADALIGYLDAHRDIWSLPAGAPGDSMGPKGEDAMRSHVVAAGTAALLATAATSQTTPVPATAPAAPASKLVDKLINQPQSATWNVFGSGQTNQLLPTGGPQNYPATRVTVAAKGANAWDVGAVSPVIKPIAAGDTILVAVYLRAPMLKDGETTGVSYLGLNQGSAPYDIVAQGSAIVTNQWKVFYASGKATKAYAAEAVTAGMHLASDKHVIDIGPVRVFDLGPNVDPTSLPKNG